MRKEQSKSMSEYFDLSQQIENGMTYFPGDPEPHIEPADTTPPWRVTHLHIGTHMGTHIDAASHFIPHGKTISDRKSTRLNSSHTVISYAVFCLKKKKTPTEQTAGKNKRH